MEELSPQEAAVFTALREADGRVVPRAELARAAGLDGLSERRVDGVLVRLRRILPPGALVTVRRRGWALRATPDVHEVGTLPKRARRPVGTPAP